MTTLRNRWSAGLLALLLPVAIAGCITVGKEFRSEAVDLVKPGQTTDQDVLKIFGNPVRTGVAEDGAREWTYAHYKASAFGGFEGRDLVLKFDADGKVKALSYHTTDPSDKMVRPK